MQPSRQAPSLCTGGWKSKWLKTVALIIQDLLITQALSGGETLFPASKARILSEILITTMYVLLNQPLCQPVPCKSLLYPQSDFTLDQSFWSFFLLLDFLLSLSLARMISISRKMRGKRKQGSSGLETGAAQQSDYQALNHPLPLSGLWKTCTFPERPGLHPDLRGPGGRGEGMVGGHGECSPLCCNRLL